MKTLLVTAFDDGFKPIGDLTAARMLAYASRHGFDFLCARDIPRGIPASWHKITLVLDALYEFDRVIWLDADQAITNPDFAPTMAEGFHVSRDWGTDATEPQHFSMGGFLACEDALPLFAEVDATRDTRLHDPFWEQTPMRELYSPRWMTIHPRRVFNAVPIAAQPTAPEPWQPGDWCAHLTSLPVEQRVRLFHSL